MFKVTCFCYDCGAKFEVSFFVGDGYDKIAQCVKCGKFYVVRPSNLPTCQILDVVKTDKP